MDNNFDKLDELLFNAIGDIKLKEYNKDEISNIIGRAELRKKRKFFMIKRLAITGSFLIIGIFLVLNICFKKDEIIITGNKDSMKNNIINLYENDNENSMAENINLNAKEAYDLATCVALVKIEPGLKGTNYDRMYGPHFNGEYRYTFVRTIGMMKILNVYKGNFNVGDVIEFRKKGGKILYSEYIKLYNENSSKAMDKKLIEEYNKLSKSLYDEVYVNVISRNSIEIQEGKEYLVYVTQKSWGDFWLEPGMVTIREYDSENNTVLNNYNKEWEPINIVLNGGE